MDCLGDHLMVCKKLVGVRMFRHNSCAGEFGAMVREARGVSALEKTFGWLGLEGTEKERNKRVDVYVRWPGGATECWDNTHPHPTCASNLAAARVPGGAASMSEKKKHAKYGPACRTLGTTFVALAGETYGRWGEETANRLRKMATSVQSEVGAPIKIDKAVLGAWWRRLSCTLQHGNAACIQQAIDWGQNGSSWVGVGRYDWRDAGKPRWG
jgi:hypothetical protein